MRVAHGLLGGAVVVVELAAEEVQPVLEEQHTVVHEVAGAGLDQEYLLVRKVFGEARGNDAPGGATAHDHEIVGGIGGNGGGGGCHDVRGGGGK